MSNQYAKIEGKDSLIKDTKTGSIINQDDKAYELAKQHKKRLLQERREKEELKQRVERLESAIGRLLDVKE